MLVNLWAEEPTYSHTPRGFLPVLAVTGSKGLQEPRTGQNAGCCQTGPAHEGAAAQTAKLGWREKKEMQAHCIHTSLCTVIFRQTCRCLLFTKKSKSQWCDQPGVYFVSESLKQSDRFMSVTLSAPPIINKADTVYKKMADCPRSPKRKYGKQKSRAVA